MKNPRRFPPPWTFEDHNDACFIVKDANGLAVAYVYYEEEPGRRIALNIAALPEAPTALRGRARQFALPLRPILRIQSVVVAPQRGGPLALGLVQWRPPPMPVPLRCSPNDLEVEQKQQGD
jgi:hypothetical protein